LNRIVSEVLDFARPIKYELAPADVNSICEDAARAVRPGTGGPSIRLKLEASLPRTTLDAERLRTTLVNVLTNATLAVVAREGASAWPDALTLTTSLKGGRLVIEVRDRGAGIAAEDLSRVFDPFFTTRRTGTGLGLAISRNIIEGMGGTITIQSQTDVGTDVRIELPVRS
jgi:signal transduction histidine kinase